MSVPGGRLDLGVAEQLPDHREAFAHGQRPRSIRSPKIMESDVVQASLRADMSPETADRSHVDRLAGPGRRKDPR